MMEKSFQTQTAAAPNVPSQTDFNLIRDSTSLTVNSDSSNLQQSPGAGMKHETDHHQSLNSVNAHNTPTRNQYQKPIQKNGTINRHKSRACHSHYQKWVALKFCNKLHVRRTRNRYRFSGTGFQYQFLVRVLSA